MDNLLNENTKEENTKTENKQDEKNKSVEKKKKKKKNRCAFKGCKKKLKMINLKCRCKNRFCDKHRLPESHDCKWNPRSDAEIENYKKNCCLNVTAHFSKIDKI